MSLQLTKSKEVVNIRPKVFEPDYKVRHFSKGVYGVENTAGVQYILVRPQGSRNFYYVEGAPLFPTLRDAVMYIVA